MQPKTESVKLIIIGMGGHGRELYSYITEKSVSGVLTSFLGFVDENKQRGSEEGVEIFGNFKELEGFLRNNQDTLFYYITAAGDNYVRKEFVRKIDELSMKNLMPWIFCHHSVNVGLSVEIGLGTCLAPGSIITTRSLIGRHCIVNVNASISHDCNIGDFVNINPGVVICGNVRIEQGCYIGAGATIIDKVNIGDWTIIGAGAVVIDDIPDHVTAVGVPAKVIKRHDSR